MCISLALKNITSNSWTLFKSISEIEGPRTRATHFIFLHPSRHGSSSRMTDTTDTPPEPEYPPIGRQGPQWDRQKMADFLRMLAATHSVSEAARSVGMSRQSAYRLRSRLKGTPFDIAWETAFRHGYDNLAHAALERALNGVEVPHYHGGELVGTSRRYDERLTVALLNMRNRFGSPMMGRYGAMAEYMSERWDELLDRVECGSLDWEGPGFAMDSEKDIKNLIERFTIDEHPSRR